MYTKYYPSSPISCRARISHLLTLNFPCAPMLRCNLRSLNHRAEWNVHKVLSIQPYFMSSPHLTPFDTKFSSRTILFRISRPIFNKLNEVSSKQHLVRLLRSLKALLDPRAIGQVPVHGFAQPLFKRHSRLPAEFPLQLLRVDGVA